MKIAGENVEEIKNLCMNMTDDEHRADYAFLMNNDERTIFEIKRLSLDGADSIFIFGCTGCHYESFHVWEHSNFSEDQCFDKLAEAICKYLNNWEVDYITDEEPEDI